MERMASVANDAKSEKSSGLPSNISFANSTASTDGIVPVHHAHSSSVPSTPVVPALPPLTQCVAPAAESANKNRASENAKRKVPQPQTAKQMYNSVCTPYA